MTMTSVANGDSHPPRMRTLPNHLMSCALLSRLVLAPRQQMSRSPRLSLLGLLSLDGIGGACDTQRETPRARRCTHRVYAGSRHPDSTLQ
jgi:hypothetical protein